MKRSDCPRGFSAATAGVRVMARIGLSLWAGLVLATAICAPARVRAAAAAPIDQVNEFRQVAFGAAPPAGMKLLERDGDLKFYGRAGDRLRFGKARLSQVIYGFYKDQFFVAILKTADQRDSRALLDEFNDRYGTPSRANSQDQRFAWAGTVNSASFSEDPTTHTAKGAVLNNAIEIAHDTAAAAQ